MSLRTLAGVVAAIILAGSAAIEAARAAEPPSLVWERHPGSLSYDVVTAVATDRTGAVVVAGETGGSMARANAGLADIFVLKYSSTGSLLWRRQLGTTRRDVPSAVAIDSSNNIVVVGLTGAWLAGPSQGGDDLFVLKYNAEGILLWKRQTGSPSDDHPGDVAVDAAGNIFFAASQLLLKYRPDGSEAWRRPAPSRPDPVSWNGVALHPDGNLIVIGSAYKSSFNSDLVLAAYSPQGALQWTRQTATATGEYPAHVAINGAGRIFGVGLEQGEDPATRHIFLRAFSSSGTALWKRLFGSSDSDDGSGIAIDAAGDIVITLQYDVDPVAKSYSSTGALQWTLPLPRPFGRTLNPATDTSGSLFIAGAINTPTARWLDGYLARYAYPSH